MVHELKKKIESGKVFFGVKETLKNQKVLKSIVVSADCRADIIKMLEEKFEVERLDFIKDELANKLGLDFKCEVFGLRK